MRFCRASTIAFLSATVVAAASVLGLLAGAKATGSQATGLDFPVIFTSRPGSSSLLPALPEPAEVYPGTLLPRHIPGKLRLLEPSGKLVELTWGRKLPDGTAIVDVMSPSVSLDGKRVVFAGIRHADDHFHIYEVLTDGSGLRQVTGTPDDEGCVEPPYLRVTAAGRQLSLSERRKTDYDDIDPAYLPDGRIVFASTRLPRKGLYKNHRVTNLWVMNADGSGKHQITYNLNAERWPYVLKDGRILYSYWSRTLSRASGDAPISGPDDEAIAGEALARKEQLVTAELANEWWPASVNPDGTDLRALTKPPHSAVHARPLFNGNIVYATSPDSSMTISPLRTALEQVPPGYIGRATGGLAGRHGDMPATAGGGTDPDPGVITMAGLPATDNLRGSGPWAASPSPVPPNKVVFSLSRNGPAGGASGAPGGDYGLYVAEDGWQAALDEMVRRHGDERGHILWDEKTSAEMERLIGLRKLFDEEGLCEADAQAVYPRNCIVREDQLGKQVETLTLPGGKRYTGPVGAVTSTDIYLNPVPESPGQRTDRGEGPIFVPPPEGLIKSIEFYAVSLEKDEHGLPTARPYLEPVGKSEVSASGAFAITVPAATPLVQFGRDTDGHLATWPSPARDRNGRSARMAAFTGDHFGYATEGVPRSFCVGCHAGHTVLPGRSVADIIAEPRGLE